MRFVQTHAPRPPAPVIGRIVLENIHGQPVATAQYNAPLVRRAQELFCPDGVYGFQRADETSTLHYRYVRRRGPEQPLTNDLTDFRPTPSA